MRDFSFVMIRPKPILLPLVTLLLGLTCDSVTADPVSLFDGKTFKGWNGETSKVWRIIDGAIVGGSLEGNPQNEFCHRSGL